MQLSKFLRTVLKLDALSCLGMAALTLPTAAMLEQPLGMQSGLLLAAGASLIPIGLFILWLGTRREAPAALVWLVIVGNLGWTAASLIAASVPEVTLLGQTLVVAQALAVLALSLAEWAGVRTSARSTAEFSA